MENVNNQNSNGCNCKMCQKWGWCPVSKSGKIFKLVIIIAVVIFVLKMIGGHSYMENYSRPVNTITVSGKGEVIVKPDIAVVSFGVSSENLDVSKAQNDSAVKMNSIIDFLKDEGVDEKDIKTTNYSIYPRYDYNRSVAYPYSSKQVLAGYVVSQSVEVKIRKIENAGTILSGVGERGATDVSGLSFTLDKSDEKKDEARSLAIADAREQAKVLAKSLDVRLVRITSFSENGNYPTYYAMEKSMAVGMGGDSIAPQLPTGENKITSSVSVTYEIR